MKKNETAHTLNESISLTSKSLSGKCSCVAGIGGYCHHVIGLLYYLANCKQLGLSSLPDDLTCTSMKQRWSIPRGRKIEQSKIEEVLVKKPQAGADYSKFIKSNLYSPATSYSTLTKEYFNGLKPEPLMASLLPRNDTLCDLETVPCKFGNVL